ERVRVLRDPLRQHRELVRVVHLAQAAAALPDLLRGLLREIEQRAVALVDRFETTRERRQALLVVDEPLRRAIDALPSRLDRGERLERRRVLRRVERRAFERAAVDERVEVGAEAVAAVADRREGGRLTLGSERRPARQPLRQHLHYGGDRRLRR